MGWRRDTRPAAKHLYTATGFAVLTLVIGIVWGIGKASVYKFIPDYFPNEVGVVGGMVGVIGGLGGFISPEMFLWFKMNFDLGVGLMAAGVIIGIAALMVGA